MKKIQLIKNAIRLYKQGRIGDAAIHKAVVFGLKANKQLEPKLANVVGYCPAIELNHLANCREDSFGFAYAQHMQKNQLTPFAISPEYMSLANQHTFALRYIITHDMFHVLLGFDTSWAGEIGVLAFAVAQNYSALQKYFALPLAMILYPIYSPKNTFNIWRSAKQGWQMGKTSQCLLGERLESMWEEPLARVRHQLGIILVDDRTA